MRALLVVGLLASSTNAHAIVGGTPSTDPSVVALVRGEGAATELVCSGTVIASHAVLSAAHCVSTGIVVIAGGDRVQPIATFIAPGFDAQTLANDVAVLVFDRALSPAPKSLSMSPPPVATAMDLVGFGRTSPTDTSLFVQRAGTATIAESTTRGIVSHGPAFTCEGDSGGPALVADVVVGVTSAGDSACADFSRHARISDHLAFIQDVVAKTRPNSGGAGARCWYDGNCELGDCREALDDPRLSFCVEDCFDGTCATGLICFHDECVHPTPSPGAIGSTCSAATECIDGACVAREGEDDLVCALRCFTDLPGFDCPGGTQCDLAADGTEACFVKPADDSCCSSSPRSSIALALLVLVQLLRGRGRP